MDALVPDSQIVDPDQPVDAEPLVKERVPAEQRKPARHHMALPGAILAVMGLATVWHGSPRCGNG